MSGIAIEDVWGFAHWTGRLDLYVVGGTQIEGPLKGRMSHYDGAQWEDVFKSDWYYDLSDQVNNIIELLSFPL